MAGTSNDDGDVLTPEATGRLLMLLAGTGHRRLSSAEIDGRTVWIKRFDGYARPFPKRFHAWLSPMLPLPFLRSSLAEDGRGLARREVRKAARFRAAGVATPGVLYSNDALIVLSEVAQIAENVLSDLRRRAPARHEDLLVEMAGALGKVHAAGLCHGRPHPRDMFIADESKGSDGKPGFGASLGFLDFEEEPEAIMPLATAQARDTWLLFMPLVGLSMSAETPARAWATYCSQAPGAVIPELRRIVSCFSILLPGLRALRPIGLGRDGRALLGSTSFLRAALRGTGATAAVTNGAAPTPKHMGTRT
jgi:hypothetical protein